MSASLNLPSRFISVDVVTFHPTTLDAPLSRFLDPTMNWTSLIPGYLAFMQHVLRLHTSLVLLKPSTSDETTSRNRSAMPKRAK